MRRATTKRLEWIGAIAVIVLGSTVFVGVGFADGSAVYAKECAKCHGADGAAETPVGKAMKVPKLTGLDKAKVVAIVRGDPKHKAVSANLSEEQMAAVAAKVAGF